MRPLLLGLGVAFILVEIVALSPTTLEGDDPQAAVAPLDPEALTSEGEPTLVTGLPKGKIPDYSVKGFDYVSTVGTEKQWKIVADRAEMFQNSGSKLVHARKVNAFLYDPEGKTTVITGREAKYFMNKRDLEVYGDVVTTFTDGFVLYSDYLNYRPNERLIHIPNNYAVRGVSQENNGQTMHFNSHGFHFAMAASHIELPEAVKVVVDRIGSPRDHTEIESDHCQIDRNKQIAYFTMSPSRPLNDRFVRINQPALFAKSRRAELNYGDFSKLLKYMVAYDDVFIKQIPTKEELEEIKASGGEAPLKYATGGQADFDQHRDVIVLTRFPQVYQDNDTVTGDVILVHRDSDIIEVENSNSFSEGGTTQ